MLREFQEEIARLRAQLAAEGGGGSSSDGSGEGSARSGSLDGGIDGRGHDAGAAAAGAEAAELSPEEVAAMRAQLESELRAGHSGGEGALDDAALAQVGERLSVLLGASMRSACGCCSLPACRPAVQSPQPCVAASHMALSPQMRQEVEVQLAGQVRRAQAERRRAAGEAARLAAEVQQQSAQVEEAAARRGQVQAHK